MQRRVAAAIAIVAILGIGTRSQAQTICPTNYDCAVAGSAPLALGVTGSGEPISILASVHFGSTSGTISAIVTENVNGTFVPPEPFSTAAGSCSVTSGIGTLDFSSVGGPKFNFVSDGGNPPAELRIINVPGTIVGGIADETVVLAICRQQ